MKTENLDIIRTNLNNLFNIVSSEGGHDFVLSLEKMFPKSKKSIKELINSADDMQLFALVKVMMRSKFKEDPKKYFDPMVAAVKDELK